MVRALAALALGVAAAWGVQADGEPSTTTASLIFQLDGFERGRVAVADLSGDGQPDLVAVSRHESAEGQAEVKLWLLERRGKGFAVVHEMTLTVRPDAVLDYLGCDLDVGDADGDGCTEAVVLAKEWQPGPSCYLSRIHVIGRGTPAGQGQEARYCLEWSSPVQSDWSNTVSSVSLLGQSLIAVGGGREVRLYAWTGSTYAEVPDKRIDLRQLVPEGEDHDNWPGLIRFGPGIGVVTGLACLGPSAGSPRFAVAARDVVSDTGGGAVVVLERQDGWQAVGLSAISQKPKGLTAGDFIPGGSQELVVTTDNDMYLTEGLILYQEQGEQWVERWRRGPTGENEPTLGVGGLDFANSGRTLAVAANTYSSEEFRSASLDLYQWQGDKGVVCQARIPCDSRLLALATYPNWEEGRDAIIVIQERGIGRLIPLPRADGEDTSGEA